MLNVATVFQSERLHFISLHCIHSAVKPPPSPAHVAPTLIKGGGSVISSIVLWDLLLPKSDRSSQTGVGQTDRNSLPCRHQSPLLLTIILICASPLVFTPGSPQCLLPTTRKECLTVMVADSQIHPCCFQHRGCKLQGNTENVTYVINSVAKTMPNKTYLFKF